jgi:large subunit ribosomal protein L17
MRHNTLKNRFGRTTSHRLAMMRNMITNLFRHEVMETTLPKAKEVRRHAEKVITQAKRVPLSLIEKANGEKKKGLVAKRIHAMRIAGETVQDGEVLKKLFDELGPRYETRNGGYTRIVRKGPRLGDGTEVGIIELVDRPEKVEPKETKKQRAEKAEAKKARSENRPNKGKHRHDQGGGTPKPSGPKGGGFDASRGRGGGRGS